MLGACTRVIILGSGVQVPLPLPRQPESLHRLGEGRLCGLNPLSAAPGLARAPHLGRQLAVKRGDAPAHERAGDQIILGIPHLERAEARRVPHLMRLVDGFGDRGEARSLDQPPARPLGLLGIIENEIAFRLAGISTAGAFMAEILADAAETRAGVLGFLRSSSLTVDTADIRGDYAIHAEPGSSVGS